MQGEGQNVKRLFRDTFIPIDESKAWLNLHEGSGEQCAAPLSFRSCQDDQQTHRQLRSGGTQAE